uniref:Uncharacterized protein n=1 Tax=Physcomitrium patens TaxID=3218 RepID=A0A7I4FUD3_PHYPA
MRVWSFRDKWRRVEMPATEASTVIKWKSSSSSCDHRDGAAPPTRCFCARSIVVVM